MAQLKKELETHDIQGIVLSGYLHLPHSNYLFLHLDDANAARAWLAGIIPLITSAKYPTGADGRAVKPAWALNVAFTAPGIEALGYVVETFSQEFKEGIAYQTESDSDEEGTCSKRLGDTGPNSPHKWDVAASGTPTNQTIHVCLMVQTATESELEERCQEQRDLLTASGLRCSSSTTSCPRLYRARSSCWTTSPSTKARKFAS